MANPKENSKEAGRSLKAAILPKPDRRWTLLFIGNRGRTIKLKRFKGMVFLTFLGLSVSIAIAVGLFFWNQSIIREKHGLENNLETLKKRIEALKHEKDILMTRLVLAESRNQANEGGAPEKASEEKATNQNESGPGETKQTPQLVAKTIDTPAKKRIEPKRESEPSETGLSIAIENFKITNKSNNNKLRIQFKIKNTSANSQHVSGHAIVVLKGDQIKQNSWLIVPRMPLVEGKPTGKQRGYSFGINYFRTMRFTTSAPKFPEKYQTASVYVFTHDGKLLHEQDFTVKVPASERTTSTPMSPGELLKALNNTSE